MSSQVLLYGNSNVGGLSQYALYDQLGAALDPSFHRMKEIHNLSECASEPKSIAAVFLTPGDAARYAKEITEQDKLCFINLFREHKFSVYAPQGIFATKGYTQTYCDDSGKIRCLELDRDTTGFLNLFPGRAIAPLFPNYNGYSYHKRSFDDFKVLSISSSKNVAQSFQSLQVLGPAFYGIDSDSDIISTFQNMPSIIKKDNTVLNTAGFAESIYYHPANAGSVILTGCMHEVDSAAICSPAFMEVVNATNEQQQKLAEELKPHDKTRREFFVDNLKMLGLHCRV